MTLPGSSMSNERMTCQALFHGVNYTIMVYMEFVLPLRHNNAVCKNYCDMYLTRVLWSINLTVSGLLLYEVMYNHSVVCRYSLLQTVQRLSCSSSLLLAIKHLQTIGREHIVKMQPAAIFTCVSTFIHQSNRI